MKYLMLVFLSCIILSAPSLSAQQQDKINLGEVFETFKDFLQSDEFSNAMDDMQQALSDIDLNMEELTNSIIINADTLQFNQDMQNNLEGFSKEFGKAMEGFTGDFGRVLEERCPELIEGFESQIQDFGKIDGQELFKSLEELLKGLDINIDHKGSDKKLKKI